MEDVGSGMERGEYRGTTVLKTELETEVLLPQPRNTRTWKKKRKSPRWVLWREHPILTFSLQHYEKNNHQCFKLSSLQKVQDTVAGAG